MATYKFTLHTTYVFPSIPYRKWDWSCVDDNYDGAPDAGRHAYGVGETEQEAILDWMEQYLEIENERR